MTIDSISIHLPEHSGKHEVMPSSNALLITASDMLKMKMASVHTATDITAIGKSVSYPGAH